ncbi:OmpA family protein [Alistipes shahii]|uniref:OmpA family protein n=1 Tax=Alistipes shahii TaxID=328814 RepID=A0A5B3FYN4_9BACT|nr:OmpA family protein [Alistipes shahii]KAA2366320.1 OmpA family protein [Alistipes shahii]
MNYCNKILYTGLAVLLLGGMFGCSVAGRLQRQQATARLAQLTRAERQERQQDSRPQVVKLQRDSNTFYLAPVDTLSNGERVMALRIEQVTVVAKARTIPERNGRVTLDFIVTLPKTLLGSSRSVVITPILHKPGESVPLEDLVIRGGRFSLLQERDYWQYETYVERFRPDTVGREAAFNRFVKFPYPEDVRLDSLVEGRSTVTYYYSQEVKTDETSKKILVTLQGQVLAVDDSAYRLPPSDTLSYVVSSMLSFVDTVPRYRIKVIDKFVTVEDRNYIQFFVGDTRVVDTQDDNRRQLDKITGLIRQIVEQQEFYVDTITLTAASSPEGAYAFNDRLSQGRAAALKRYLVRRYGRSIDTMLTVRWVAEDWQELTNRIRTDREVVSRDAILELIVAEKNPDRREQAIRQRFPKEYAYIRSVIYPQLRAVNFRYSLRRKGMVKDTIHTTELDTAYARGVQLLQKRKYAKALYILNDYNDRNTVVAHLSLDHNERAMELLATMPKDAVTEYLRAIACSRLGRKAEGREHFLEACRLDGRMEYRGNLDPEIAELLKQ